MALREKCPVFGVFLIRNFPHSDGMWRDTFPQCEFMILTDAVFQMNSVKKLFLNFLHNSQENTYVKKILRHRGFPASFAKILRTPFFKGHLWWLLLY